MICPSCNDTLLEEARYCVHCGVGITRRSVQVVLWIANGAWVARRALGGLFTGAIGCVISFAVLRTISFQGGMQYGMNDLLNFFPGQSLASTAILGCFVGAVGGMIERSVYKSFLGGFLGACGGLLAGVFIPFLHRVFDHQLYGYSFTTAGAWAVAGSLVGLASGMLEGTKNKMVVGAIGGFLGGALGGGIGSQLYGALLMEVEGINYSSWILGRLVEFVSGGVIGAGIWLFLGIAEKLYIFRRRQLLENEKKVCDFCHAENGIRAWYCAQCGSAIQVAATRDQIRATPFRGLERVANAFQFLSWLSATTGCITAVVVFFCFILQNFLFALFGSVTVGLGVYVLVIFFKAISDLIKLVVSAVDRNAGASVQK